MALFESLLGFLAGSAAAVTGTGINAHNKKKRWEAYQTQEAAKVQAKVDYGRALQAAEDAETAAFRRQLEGLIGGPLEEDQKKTRYYNLPREYELALSKLDEMFVNFKKSYPPGSVVRRVQCKFDCHYSQAAGQTMCDYIPIYHEVVLPYADPAYEKTAELVFWYQKRAEYKGPQIINEKSYAVTYFVGPGTYALGEARKQIIREGFLPSNCRSRLWINWSPYVRWLGTEWNDEFHTAVDLGARFETHWYSAGDYTKPRLADHLIYEEQTAYEKAHPEHFRKETAHESSTTETDHSSAI